MTAYDLSVAFLGKSDADVLEKPVDYINRLLGPLPSVLIDYTWVPQGSLMSYTINGTVYNSGTPQTPINQAITFTAKPAFPYGVDLSIVDYRWDFGDGVTGKGLEVTHTYLFASPYTQCVLCITDDRLRKTYVGHRLNLYVP